MHRILAVLAVVIIAAGPVVASDRTDVMATVNQFVDGFNKGDAKSALAACADQTSIIDEFPPHEWHGAGACKKWMDDYDADAKANAIADSVVTLGKPRHVDISGDRAYVVIPSDYSFKKKGKPVKETGSMFTFALQKGAAGWRITGWSWAKS
jgi:ketosteroid isomerase-like protein